MTFDTSHTPPVAKTGPATAVHHGISRTDEYAWLRAENWRDVMQDPTVLAADIRAHLDAENTYFEAVTAGTVDLQEALVAEMRGRIKEDDSSVPAADGPYAYATRYLEGGEHPQLVRTARDGGAETVLLDADQLATGKDYFRLESADHSPDHALLAWSADDTGGEFATMRIRALETGKELDDVLENTSGAVVWAPDCLSIYYVRLDDNHRPRWVYQHRLGAPVEDDRLIYEETDSGFFVGIDKTRSGRFLIIDCHDHQTSEVQVLDLDQSDPALSCIAPRLEEEQYSLDHHGDDFFILTNAGEAEDFKIVTAPVASAGRENWQDLISHEPGRLIIQHDLFADHLTWLERQNGLPRIMIRRLADGETHAIDFAEEAYSLGMQAGYEFDTSQLRFTYSSMTTPAQVFDYDLESRERFLRKTQEVPSGHDPADYVTERLFAKSDDGEEVPVTILAHRDTPRDGTAPCLLYGYGSYGMSMPAAFRVGPLSLADRGFIYAIAHVRGGKEKGFAWYANGRRELKTNTFTDFTAVARHLITEKYTGKGRIIAEGGSAGGMLMGAVANMAPELFGGIVAEVPFVDVLGTMLDDTLPLTPPEWPEWGNPIADKKAYERIAAYSPYDQVGALPYPPILAMAGLTDPRVTYWEPAKWVARLRVHSTGVGPIALKTEMHAGHGGQAGRFDRLKDTALAWAFALTVTDMTS